MLVLVEFSNIVFFLVGAPYNTCMCLHRESRNLPDLCVDTVPCDRGVCGAHDPRRHRSGRLGRRSDRTHEHA